MPESWITVPMSWYRLQVPYKGTLAEYVCGIEYHKVYYRNILSVNLCMDNTNIFSNMDMKVSRLMFYEIFRVNHISYMRLK